MSSSLHSARSRSHSQIRRRSRTGFQNESSGNDKKPGARAAAESGRSRAAGAGSNYHNQLIGGAYFIVGQAGAMNPSARGPIKKRATKGARDGARHPVPAGRGRPAASVTRAHCDSGVLIECARPLVGAPPDLASIIRAGARGGRRRAGGLGARRPGARFKLITPGRTPLTGRAPLGWRAPARRRPSVTPINWARSAGQMSWRHLFAHRHNLAIRRRPANGLANKLKMRSHDNEVGALARYARQARSINQPAGTPLEAAHHQALATKGAHHHHHLSGRPFGALGAPNGWASPRGVASGRGPLVGTAGSGGPAADGRLVSVHDATGDKLTFAPCADMQIAIGAPAARRPPKWARVCADCRWPTRTRARHVCPSKPTDLESQSKSKSSPKSASKSGQVCLPNARPLISFIVTKLVRPRARPHWWTQLFIRLLVGLLSAAANLSSDQSLNNISSCYGANERAAQLIGANVGAKALGARVAAHYGATESRLRHYYDYYQRDCHCCRHYYHLAGSWAPFVLLVAALALAGSRAPACTSASTTRARHSEGGARAEPKLIKAGRAGSGPGPPPEAGRPRSPASGAVRPPWPRLASGHLSCRRPAPGVARTKCILVLVLICALGSCWRASALATPPAGRPSIIGDGGAQRAGDFWARAILTKTGAPSGLGAPAPIGQEESCRASQVKGPNNDDDSYDDDDKLEYKLPARNKGARPAPRPRFADKIGDSRASAESAEKLGVPSARTSNQDNFFQLALGQIERAHRLATRNDSARRIDWPVSAGAPAPAGSPIGPPIWPAPHSGHDHWRWRARRQNADRAIKLDIDDDIEATANERDQSSAKERRPAQLGRAIDRRHTDRKRAGPAPRPAQWAAPSGANLFALASGANGLLEFVQEPTNSARNCPRECNCVWKNGKQFADCSNQRARLRQVPAGLDPLLQVLNLSMNHLEHLPQAAFVSLQLNNLQRIYLSK